MNSRPINRAARLRIATRVYHDVPLDFDTLQPLGTFIGSAAVVVLSCMIRHEMPH